MRKELPLVRCLLITIVLMGAAYIVLPWPLSLFTVIAGCGPLIVCLKGLQIAQKDQSNDTPLGDVV